MKVFIAGARSVKQLDEYSRRKIESIFNKGYDVIVGDCYGVDAAVQRMCVELRYKKVTVYASNGIARNNLGNWKVMNVAANHSHTGFDFYRQKDVAMANDADFGFMIWDGISRGTYSNIQTLAKGGKQVLVHITNTNNTCLVKNEEDARRLQPKSIGRQAG